MLKNLTFLVFIAVFFIHPWTAYPPGLEVTAEATAARMLEPGSDSLIAILLVVERPLDTIRTSVNVEGDLVGSLVVDSYPNRRV